MPTNITSYINFKCNCFQKTLFYLKSQFLLSYYPYPQTLISGIRFFVNKTLSRLVLSCQCVCIYIILYISRRYKFLLSISNLARDEAHFHLQSWHNSCSRTMLHVNLGCKFCNYTVYDN